MTRLELTAQGKAVLERSSERRLEILECVTEGWTAEEIYQLIERLDALQNGFDRLEQSH